MFLINLISVYINNRHDIIMISFNIKNSLNILKGCEFI